MAVVLALAAALSFGIADFAGGVGARRARPLAVSVAAQVVGVLTLPAFLLVVPGDVSVAAMVTGTAAGLFGGTGLALYFTGMRDAAMGVVAPLSAVAAAAVPVAAGLLVGGERPSTLAWVGIVLALPAIHLAASAPPDEDHLAAPPPGVAAFPQVGPGSDGGRRRGILLGLVSGAAFGCFLVLLDAAPADSGAWPLVGAKTGAIVAILVLVAARRDSPVPARAAWWLVGLSGVADSIANLLFLLATRGGLLSLVSVISSQYPVVVVLLSWALLHEQLGRRQQVGAALALAAVAMISLG